LGHSPQGWRSLALGRKGEEASGRENRIGLWEKRKQGEREFFNNGKWELGEEGKEKTQILGHAAGGKRLGVAHRKKLGRRG